MVDSVQVGGQGRQRAIRRGKIIAWLVRVVASVRIHASRALSKSLVADQQAARPPVRFFPSAFNLLLRFELFYSRAGAVAYQVNISQLLLLAPTPPRRPQPEHGKLRLSSFSLASFGSSCSAPSPTCASSSSLLAYSPPRQLAHPGSPPVPFRSRAVLVQACFQARDPSLQSTPTSELAGPADPQYGLALYCDSLKPMGTTSF